MTDALPPPFDPAVHTLDDNPIVRLELYCECGGLLRQTDPVSHCLPQLEDFRTKHADPGHSPVSAEASLAEREARREAGFRAAGRQAEYEPKEHPVGGSGFDWTSEETS